MYVINNGTKLHMNKLLWAITGAVTAAVGSPAPPALQTFGWCILLMTFCDTCAGFYVAARFREVESRKFIEKIADKCVLFLIMGLVAFVASVMLRNWIPCFAVATCLIAYEGLSLVESGKRLARREAQGGVLLKTLEKIGKIFADAPSREGMTVEQTDTQTQKTTVTMSGEGKGKQAG